MPQTPGDPIASMPVPNAPGDPIISVVVPTYDRAAALAKCLHALAKQTLAPGRFEVIVCDDGCSPPVTVAQAELLAALNGTSRVRVVRQENGGPAAARNLGAAAARGRYLAFTDDDCEPAPDWLERLVARFDEGEEEVLLGGSMRNALVDDVYASATHAIMDFAYAEHWRQSGTRLFSTSNLSLPTAGFRAIGGFSPRFPDAAGEDYDLCWRWQETGRRAAYVADAVIVHSHPLTFRDYLRQHFRYGRGLLRVRRRLVARRRRNWSAGPGFYVRLVLHPLRRWWDPAAWRSAALIGASQVATVAGAAIEFVASYGQRAQADVAPSAETPS